MIQKTVDSDKRIKIHFQNSYRDYSVPLRIHSKNGKKYCKVSIFDKQKFYFWKHLWMKRAKFHFTIFIGTKTEKKIVDKNKQFFVAAKNMRK